MDYRDYVSFSVPPERAGLPESEGLTELPLIDRRNVEQALQEIASTPEGADLLRRAAAAGPDGKVNIMMNVGDYTFALAPNDFAVGTSDGRARVVDPSTNQGRDLSIQNLVYHELFHLANDHGHAPDRDAKGFSRSEEAQSVRAANLFMHRYYNEPADETHKNVDLNGTPGWDVNPNFSLERGARLDAEAEALRKNLGTISPEEAASLGPEIESLYQHRDDPEKFRAQREELTLSGSDVHLNTAIESLNRIVSPAPAQNEFADAGAAPAPSAAISLAMKPM